MRHLLLFENFTNPSQYIKTKIDNIISNIPHRRGRDFFDALDAAVKDESIVLELTKSCENKWIASSGGFGDILYRLYKENKFKCKGLVIFNGKMLTNKIGVSSWYPQDFDLNDKQFVYLDDSYFSGSTVRKISDFLRDKNSSIDDVYVIYDGSEIKSSKVHYFYRYWDHRDLEEYKKQKKI